MSQNKILLTPEERSGCYMLGALMKAAEYSLPPRILADALYEEKSAEGGGIMSVPDSLGKGVITLSVITGLPLGIAAHIIGKKIQSRTDKEKELELRRNYYTEAANSLQQGLPPVDGVEPDAGD